MSFSSEPRVVRIELHDLPFLNANDRLHHMERSKRTQVIRSAAYNAVKEQPFMPMGKVRIRVIYWAPDNRRRDVISGNLGPTIKAAIDGIVDAKLIKDDNDSIVQEYSIVKGGVSEDKKLRLVIQVIEDV